MGLTSSDRNKITYSHFIKRGMTHSEALNMFPEWRRKQVLKDLNKGFINSHFGVKPIWFFVITAISIIAAVIFVLSLAK